MNFQSMLSKLKHDAAQPQVQQPPRKKQKTVYEESSSTRKCQQQQQQQQATQRHYPFPKRKVCYIYLACPPNVQTGGPEAIHQLCHKINSLSQENSDGNVTAYMLYIKEQPQTNRVQHVAHAKTLHAYEMSYSNLKVATEFPMNDGNDMEGKYEGMNGKMDSNDIIYNNSMIIWPECWTHLIDSLQPDEEEDDGNNLNKIKRFQTAIWWLSVNNNNARFKDWWRKDILHLHQSEYAKCYVSDNIQKEQNVKTDVSDNHNNNSKQVMKSSNNEFNSSKQKKDDKNPETNFIESAIIPMTEFIPIERYCEISSSVKRTLQIVYNPFKGVHYTDSIIKRSGTKFTFTPIGSLEKRISPSDVTKMLNTAKVYIDFGPHPGMDRLPREAALCGCIVITNKEGAAFYHEDVPIPNEYKFEDFNVDSIHRLLTTCIDDFETRGKDFDAYRNWIRSQESTMDECVKGLLSKVNHER